MYSSVPRIVGIDMQTEFNDDHFFTSSNAYSP